MTMTEKQLQEEKQLIEKFLHLNAVKIIVSIPQISHQGPNTLAGCAPESGAVYFPSSRLASLPDAVFALAHEMRHMWQYQKAYPKYRLEMMNYRTADLCKTTDEYNLQWPELDANAFAAYWCRSRMGITPSFGSLSEDTRKRIYDNAVVIGHGVTPPPKMKFAR